MATALQMNFCVFCTRLHTLEVLFEDARTAIILHEDWAVRGHVMVVWKAHVENISNLTSDEWIHFAAIYRTAERTLLELTGADRAIVIKLGIATPHLHFHIYPVPAALSRAEVMEIIDARRKEAVDPAFVAALRAALDRALSTE